MNKLNIGVIAAITLAFSAAALAEATTKEAPAAPAAKREATGAYVDDAVITTKVSAAFLGEATLKSLELKVETYKGVVQLSGFVSSRADIDKAVAIARGVKGVHTVKNDLILKGQQ